MHIITDAHDNNIHRAYRGVYARCLEWHKGVVWIVFKSLYLTATVNLSTVIMYSVLDYDMYFIFGQFNSNSCERLVCSIVIHFVVFPMKSHLQVGRQTERYSKFRHDTESPKCWCKNARQAFTKTGRYDSLAGERHVQFEYLRTIQEAKCEYNTVNNQGTYT